MDEQEIRWEMIGKFDVEFGRVPTLEELNDYIKSYKN